MYRTQSNKRVSAYTQYAEQTRRTRGFTLIEVIITVGIAAIVTAMITISWRRLGTVGSLERAATRIAQDIRSAQALALATDPTRIGGPPCGFGVHAPDPAGGGPDSYIIYAKLPSSTTVPCGIASREWRAASECFDANLVPASCPAAHRITTTTVKRFILPEINQVRFSSTQFDDVYYEPPDPRTYIMQVNPSGSASTVLATAGLHTQSFAIVSRSDASQARIVQVDTGGRVMVIGGQIFSEPCVPLSCDAFSPGYECGTWADGCGDAFTCGNSGACIIPPNALGDICCVPGDPLCNPSPGVGQCYPAIPDPPTGLVANTVEGAFQIALSWVDNSVNEVWFEVWRCNGQGCDPLAGVLRAPNPGPEAIAFTDSSLSPESWYTYAVLACNGTGCSIPTNSDDALTVPPPPIQNLAPENFAGWFYRNKVRWDDSCVNAFPSCWYQAARCIGTGCTPSPFVINNIPASPVCDTNNAIPPVTVDCNPAPAPSDLHTVNPNNAKLYPNTTYGYRMYAVNAGGRSAPSDTRYSTTPDIAPNIPTGVITNPISTTEIEVWWTDDRDWGYAHESAFIAYKCQGSGCDPLTDPAPTTVFVAPGNNPLSPLTTIHPSTGLTAGNVYRYCVKAQNGTGTTACSSPAAEGMTKPNPPTGLVFNPDPPTSSGQGATAFSTIGLSWTNPAPSALLTNIRIERFAGTSCGGAAEASALIGSGILGPQLTSYTDALNPITRPNTDYAYHVKAVNPSGESAASNCVTRKTPNVPPLAPTLNTAAAPGGAFDRVDLAWTDNAFGFVWGNETEFRVRRCQGPSCAPTVDINVTPSLPANPPGPTTYTNTGLTGDTTYGYCVFARNAAGDSACSNSKYATTFAGVPENLRVTVGSRVSTKTNFATGAYTAQIGIEWTNPSPAASVVWVKIERAPWGGAVCGSWAQIMQLPVNPPLPNSSAAQTYTDTQASVPPLTPNTSYCYRVRVASATGDSNYSPELTPLQLNGGTEPPITLDVTPNTPTGLIVTAPSATVINLTWSQNDTAIPLGAWGNETTFRIRRCNDNGCASPAEIASVGTDVIAYGDTTTEASTHGYCIAARKTGVTPTDSPCSNPIVYVTTPPRPPILVSAVATGQSSADITWDDDSTGETNTFIERATGACPQTVFATIPAGTFAGTPTNDPAALVTDNSLSPETLYCYRVRAANTGGSAVSVSALTVQTWLNAPQNFTLANGGNNKIDLAWNDMSSAETGYEIQYYCTGDVDCPASFTALTTRPANSVTYTHNISGTISNGSLMFYRIRATGAANNSSWVTPTPASFPKP